MPTKEKKMNNAFFHLEDIVPEDKEIAAKMREIIEHVFDSGPVDLTVVKLNNPVHKTRLVGYAISLCVEGEYLLLCLTNTPTPYQSDTIAVEKLRPFDEGCFLDRDPVAFGALMVKAYHTLTRRGFVVNMLPFGFIDFPLLAFTHAELGLYGFLLVDDQAMFSAPNTTTH